MTLKWAFKVFQIWFLDQFSMSFNILASLELDSPIRFQKMSIIGVSEGYYLRNVIILNISVKGGQLFERGDLLRDAYY